MTDSQRNLELDAHPNANIARRYEVVLHQRFFCDMRWLLGAVLLWGSPYFSLAVDKDFSSLDECRAEPLV